MSVPTPIESVQQSSGLPVRRMPVVTEFDDAPESAFEKVQEPALTRVTDEPAMKCPPRRFQRNLKPADSRPTKLRRSHAELLSKCLTKLCAKLRGK